MNKQTFISELTALKYSVKELPNNFITFEFQIPLGRFSGQTVQIAFLFENSYPMNPPSGGPHFKPHLLPITGGAGLHPFGAIHNSPLGPEWQYWSRPFTGWNGSDKSARAYMGHIKNLLATVK